LFDLHSASQSNSTALDSAYRLANKLLSQEKEYTTAIEMGYELPDKDPQLSVKNYTCLHGCAEVDELTVHKAMLALFNCS